MKPADLLPEELRGVAARLQAERTQADPLELDEIKRRVLARSSNAPGRSTSVKSRLATIGTLVALVGGTGGAIAVGSNSNGNGFRASAAAGQYCPPDQQGAAFDQGFNHGFNGGWNRGFNPGFNNGFNSGWLRGFETASGRARDVGAGAAAGGPPYPDCDAYFDEGFLRGWDGGWHRGFDRGFHPGWHRGFNSGFNAGWRARHH